MPVNMPLTITIHIEGQQDICIFEAGWKIRIVHGNKGNTIAKTGCLIWFVLLILIMMHMFTTNKKTVKIIITENKHKIHFSYYIERIVLF